MLSKRKISFEVFSLPRSGNGGEDLESGRATGRPATATTQKVKAKLLCLYRSWSERLNHQECVGVLAIVYTLIKLTSSLPPHNQRLHLCHSHCRQLRITHSIAPLHPSDGDFAHWPRADRAAARFDVIPITTAIARDIHHFRTQKSGRRYRVRPSQYSHA